MSSDDDADKKPAASKPASASAKERDESKKEELQERSEPVAAVASASSGMKAKTTDAKPVEIISSSARTPQDVLCGRGMPFQSYPGNITMHELVGEHRDEYMSSKRSQKPLVIKSIIQTLKDSGARFLKPHGEFHSNEDDLWVEVDEQYIYDKISHVMRHRQRAARSEASSSDTTSAKKDKKSALESTAGTVHAAAAPIQSSAAVSAPVSSIGGDNSALLAAIASAGQLQQTSAMRGLGGVLAQQQNTQSLLGSVAGRQNQEAILQALLASRQPSLLPSLGLLGQSPSSSLLLSRNLLGAQQEQQQQQQLLSLLGLQAPPSQPSLDQSILAQLRQDQLLRGMESQRLLAGAGSHPQAQPSSALNSLISDELRRRALQSQAQDQNHANSSKEGKEEEKE